MGTVNARTLAVLPQETLPEFDALFVARLERKDAQTMPLDAHLIARYSTKAILPKVKSVYGNAPGRWDCVTEDGFVLLFSSYRPELRSAALGGRSQCLHDRVDPRSHEDEALGRD
jgi:hypothetical protein